MRQVEQALVERALEGLAGCVAVVPLPGRVGPDHVGPGHEERGRELGHALRHRAAGVLVLAQAALDQADQGQQPDEQDLCERRWAGARAALDLVGPQAFHLGVFQADRRAVPAPPRGTDGPARPAGSRGGACRRERVVGRLHVAELDQRQEAHVMPVALGVGKTRLAPDCHQLLGEREALREALGARHDPRVRGQDGGERLRVADTARHRQGSTDHRPPFAVGHAEERLLRQGPSSRALIALSPDGSSASARRRSATISASSSMRSAQSRPIVSSGLGHALAIAPRLGRGGERAQKLVGALVPRELQDAAALELEVEPLGLAHVGQPLLRVQGTLVLLAGDVEGQLAAASSPAARA